MVCMQDPSKAKLSAVQELMDTRRQLRTQEAAKKKLQEQVASYEKELEALRSNFSVSQSQASIAKVSTEINSKVRGMASCNLLDLETKAIQQREISSICNSAGSRRSYGHSCALTVCVHASQQRLSRRVT